MKTHVSTRTNIPEITDENPRPLWSVMIPTYNCARYLRETLKSVLTQAPGPESMQIEVIDDHSFDDPASVVAELGGERVRFYQQPKNVGHIDNFATCLKRSRGKLIHLLHGDDYVLPGFYEKMAKTFLQCPDIGAAFCRHIFMDNHGHWQSISDLEQRESGILKNWLEKLASEQRIMTPSIVVKREVYETLGGFDQRLICSEDWEMWVRIAVHYPVWYETEPLAVYRMHPDSNTGRHVRTGEDMRYTCEAIDIFTAYLPDEIAYRVSRQAKETYAFSALEMAYSLFVRGDIPATFIQMREAIRLSSSFRVIRQIVKLLGTIGMSSMKKIIMGGKTHH
ncbi:MAG: glycosyltransferase family 2 protein [Candidatus Loosdrechtia sp.]|uniref:glycosyltransferase family 2 protein n=1 Tax=Candidatus Loosdrechtia sp. TaxID=3101272 RepID=UPI003A6A40E4|nr:MAG: glycosyltransferase [Candidatus Jettenia sp. AMX2]